MCGPPLGWITSESQGTRKLTGPGPTFEDLSLVNERIGDFALIDDMVVGREYLVLAQFLNLPALKSETWDILI
jgi:hypothetical protein